MTRAGVPRTTAKRTHTKPITNFTRRTDDQPPPPDADVMITIGNEVRYWMIQHIVVNASQLHELSDRIKKWAGDHNIDPNDPRIKVKPLPHSNVIAIEYDAEENQ